MFPIRVKVPVVLGKRDSYNALAGQSSKLFINVGDMYLPLNLLHKDCVGCVLCNFSTPKVALSALFISSRVLNSLPAFKVLSLKLNLISKSIILFDITLFVFFVSLDIFVLLSILNLFVDSILLN